METRELTQGGEAVSTKAAKPGKKDKKGKLLILLLLLLLLLAGAVIYYLLQNKSGMELDDNSTIGIMPGIDIAQRQAELQAQLDEGMIAFSINTNPVFASGSAEGNLMIENPGNNAKLIVVELYADETGELIYKSKALPAGSYIEKTSLDKVLEPGEYAVTAYFNAYRESDQSYIGQAGAAIKLTVLS